MSSPPDRCDEGAGASAPPPERRLNRIARLVQGVALMGQIAIVLALAVASGCAPGAPAPPPPLPSDPALRQLLQLGADVWGSDDELVVGATTDIGFQDKTVSSQMLAPAGRVAEPIR